MISLISRVSLVGSKANIVVSVMAPKLVIYLKLTAKSTAAKYSNFLNCSLWTISRVYFTIHSRIFFFFLLMLFQNFSIEQCCASAGCRRSGGHSFEIGSSYFLQLIPQVLLLTVFVLLMTWPPVSKQIASWLQNPLWESL